jgi:response regulator RpfG family c-di-GMP phosphodiesterase
LNYFKKDSEKTLTYCSLVITDYKMPRLSVIDFLKKIREKDTDCKIKMMLLSAFMKSDLNINVPLTNLKIDKILAKPKSLENLWTKSRSLL